MAGAVSYSTLVPQPDTSRRPEQNKTKQNKTKQNKTVTYYTSFVAYVSLARSLTPLVTIEWQYKYLRSPGRMVARNDLKIDPASKREQQSL